MQIGTSSYKTKIVYCKDGTRKGKHENTKFKFLGYEFRRRITRNRYTKSMRLNFTPAICPEAKKAITAKLRELNSRRRTDLEIEQIAAYLNPKLIGWLNYYGKFIKSAMYVIWKRVNSMLVSWARRKYKHLRHHKTNASMFIERIAKTRSNLFIKLTKWIPSALAVGRKLRPFFCCFNSLIALIFPI